MFGLLTDTIHRFIGFPVIENALRYRIWTTQLVEIKLFVQVMWKYKNHQTESESNLISNQQMAQISDGKRCCGWYVSHISSFSKSWLTQQNLEASILSRKILGIWEDAFSEDSVDSSARKLQICSSRLKFQPSLRGLRVYYFSHMGCQS